ncbi:preprotein translocase subunit YajC [Sporosalibacterium faouarense]|uniref:preprotein translocase subunit YajC n=1 Tax=Sporosalibacterium faouarense TaxID=516123 RepID=UPI00192ABD9C|nr:preprotein translocase subunit YajC [Sporosalibacterium faouarense]
MQYTSLIFPILLLAVFYFLVIRPQQKKNKQINEMRNSLKVGDEITTIGGIYGKVLKIKEDVVTVEVGADKFKMNITKWAIGTVVNNDDK